MKHVFILGSERSGSTWLGNIFSAHPQVGFYMEPFSRYTGLFPELSGRNGCVAAPQPEQVRVVKRDVARLKRAKYPLLYRPGRPPVLLSVDRAVARLCNSLSRFTGSTVSRRSACFSVLNYNAAHLPPAQVAAAERHTQVAVIKELRANFKGWLLASAFPEARFVVVIRHPGAQITSIIKHFQRGRLGELRQDLNGFRDAVETQQRLAMYRPLLEDVDPSAPAEALLPIWWLVNYDVLLTDLAAAGARTVTITHESLSRAPLAESAKLFGFCEMEMAPEVTRYIHTSSTRDGDPAVTMDTHRQSDRYYLQAIDNVPEVLSERIDTVLTRWLGMDSNSPISPLLGEYLQRTAIS